MAKETTIKVWSIREDDYGNLWVTPEGGGDEVKIGEKRSHLHELFQQGNEVKLHWDSYKNRSYVADAELITGTSEPPLVKEAEKLGAEAIPSDPKNRSYALSYAKDIAVAKISKGVEMTVEKTIVVAKEFAKYLDTGA